MTPRKKGITLQDLLKGKRRSSQEAFDVKMAYILGEKRGLREGVAIYRKAVKKAMKMKK